jgi:hypothetical protein
MEITKEVPQRSVRFWRMTIGPPERDDPTIEEEAPDFDGTSTDQLDNTYRLRVALASENRNGRIGFDDRGQARWTWATELGEAPASTGTFNQLKALDNPKLKLEGSKEPEPEPTPPPSRKEGYNPYARSPQAPSKKQR